MGSRLRPPEDAATSADDLAKVGRASDSSSLDRSVAGSGRRQPRRGERQRIVLNDQPTLIHRVGITGPEATAGAGGVRWRYRKLL
jgi:hypothetical protein